MIQSTASHMKAPEFVKPNHLSSYLYLTDPILREYDPIHSKQLATHTSKPTKK
uniref:Uncharacterized protein n=1 Tax=Arundo donax TaxID=35708 RepID=A0A0A9FCA7_ARUDO